jgi:hypothetical protein
MTVRTKWDENQEYFSSNCDQLKKKFPGMYVTIVNQKVEFATHDDNVQFWMWDHLRQNEKEEAYTRYIPRRNEVILI